MHENVLNCDICSNSIHHLLVLITWIIIKSICHSTGISDTLGTELLESLIKMAPSKEEERKLKEHKDDSPTKLGPAEKFLKAVLDVPFAFKRVEAMLYTANFESEVEYLRKSFQTLEVISHSFPLIYLVSAPLFHSLFSLFPPYSLVHVMTLSFCAFF